MSVRRFNNTTFDNNTLSSLCKTQNRIAARQILQEQIVTI